MAIVTVHTFTYWSIADCKFKLQPGKRTAVQIRTMHGCDIVPGTAQSIDAGELDEYGRYFPKAEKGVLVSQ